MNSSRGSKRAGDSKPATDTPGVVAPPPLIYLAAILIGLGLHRLQPIGVLPQRLGTVAGVALVLAALALFASALRELHRSGTPVETRKATTAIVSRGPYRISRNPIYLAMTVLHLGIAVWVNSAGLSAMLIPAFVVISTGVIAREERYLERRFGDDYLDYKSSVRRWL